MTCIVGLKHKGKVYIGADSAGVGGNYITIRKDPKVFKTGEFVIGATTSFRMIQLLMFKLTPPKLPECMDIFEYMCTLFMDEVIKIFKDSGFEKAGDRDYAGGKFLVGHKDRLFKVYEDYQVEESINQFSACGCGEDLAMGCLATIELDNPMHAVTRSLEVAELFSTGVAAPFNILTT